MRQRLVRVWGCCLSGLPVVAAGVFALLAYAESVRAEVRLEVPLSVSRADGADISYGEIATYRDVPKQANNREIVLEAEQYDTVTWQEARIKNLVSEQWLDDAEDRVTRKSFKDEDASGGACVKLAEALSYPFYCSEPGQYFLWMRY